jgi:hypothetical protein
LKAMQAAGTGPGTWGARIFLEAQRREPRFTRRKMGEQGQQELEELGRDAARPWVGKKRGLAERTRNGRLGAGGDADDQDGLRRPNG